MTRTDLLTAKALLDNLDQVGTGLTLLASENGTVSVTFANRPNSPVVIVPAADATQFLTTLQTSIIAQLAQLGVE